MPSKSDAEMVTFRKGGGDAPMMTFCARYGIHMIVNGKCSSCGKETVNMVVPTPDEVEELVGEITNPFESNHGT